MAFSLHSRQEAMRKGNLNAPSPVANWRPRDVRKKFGIYYTPDELSEIVTAWAIRSAEDTVLEPSFGGCGFLAAASSRLEKLGSTTPRQNLYGCDIDKEAFTTLQLLFEGGVGEGHFLTTDFLTAKDSDWPHARFDVVLGNPPFVSHHNMPKIQKKTAKKMVAVNGTALSGTASLWAYFVIHAVSFLCNGGRLAFILPDALLTSDYAEPVRSYIFNHFRSVLVARKSFRMFTEAGTSERTLLLLAEGYSSKEISARVQVTPTYTISELRSVVEQANSTNGKSISFGTAKFERWRNVNCPIFQKILTDSRTCKFEDVLGVEIGLVTGANKYFVIDKTTLKKWDLPKSSLLPILSRTADASGLHYSDSDHKAAASGGRRCWLFRPNKLGPRYGPVRQYLASVPRDLRRTTVWFKKRKLWFSPEGYAPPDGFLTYMNHGGPRIILNNGQVDCTNTLHRINFKECIGPTQKKLIAISLLTTFSQISAELEGRAYGGGVLKVEPSEFRRMRLTMPKGLHPHTVSRVFRIIDEHLRAGDSDAARKTADNLVLGAVLGSGKLISSLKSLEDVLTSLRSERSAS